MRPDAERRKVRRVRCVERVAPKQHFVRLCHGYVCLKHLPPTNPLTPGDIAVLASLTQIVQLDLYNCENLQGRSVDGGRG